MVVMKKERLPTFILPTARMLIYLSIFIVSTAVYTMLPSIINFELRSHLMVLGLSILVVLILAGALLFNERNVLSRVTSAATLLILGLIALRIEHTTISTPYLLVIALGVAYLGARPALHHQLSTFRKTILCSLAAVLVAAILSIAFIYGVTVIDRLALQ